jgi:morphogenetic protein associated with SpoVID
LKIHIVQKGDTLWKIAKKYGVDFEELKKMNSQLSNPDMIMPGMKIKVPGGSVSVKKEGMAGGMKEMPMAEHPYADQTKTYPVTEIDEMPPAQKPMKEMPMQPIQPMPMKEMPMQPKPVKEAPVAPKKEMPVVPKMPVLPKLPPIQPIKQDVDVMNTDINTNFYTLNMSLPPKPPKPDKEMPVMEESSEEMEMPVMPQMMQMPTYMPPCVPVHPTCMPVPITPIMPGYGYNFVPCVPCPPGAMPMQYPMGQQPMYQGAPMMHGQDVQGDSMMEESPEVMGMQEMGDGGYMPPGQMPDYGMDANQGYAMPMNMMPGYQQPMHYQAPMMEQEGMGMEMMGEGMPQGYGVPPYMAMPPMPPMPDCGCGPQPYYMPMPYSMPQAPYGYMPQAAPYGYAPQMNPYGGYMPQQMGMTQPYMPQARMDENDFFGFPDYDEDDDDIV